MKVKDIEEVITTKVEEILKEFKKIEPVVIKIVKQIENNFKKIDVMVVANKINQVIQFVNNKIKNLKKSNQNNEIKININNKDAQEQISQLQKEIDSLQKKINSRQIKLDITNDTLDKIKAKTNDEVVREMPNAGNKTIKQETYNRLNNDVNYNSLLKESDNLNNDIIKYDSLLDTAKTKMSRLKQETSQTSNNQNKLSNYFNGFKGKIEQVKPSIGNIKNGFSQIPNITKSITTGIKKMGTGIKVGLGHIFNYAGTLISLKGIYSTLSNSANAWLSSQNSDAQQLSANIEYMRYAMGGVFAPIIEYIVNLVYQLMKAIQSVVYAFTGLNIFAKSTASSMNKTAGSAKQTNKSLSGIHGDINNVSVTDNNNAGNGVVSPNIDLSQVDISMNNSINSIKERLITLFEPIQNAWNNYGATMIESVKNALMSIVDLMSLIGKSFSEVWLNGTGEITISLILQILTNIFDIISAIAISWLNAWNNNGNGIAIIQNLWNSLNNILGIINDICMTIKEWWQSDSGQAWSNAIVSIFKTTSGWIEIIISNIKKIWDNGISHIFIELSNLGSNIAVVFDNVTRTISPLVDAIINLTGNALSGLLDIIGIVLEKFNNFMDFFLGENAEKLDTWSILIGSLATAISLIVGALTLWNIVQGVWNVIVGIGSTIGTVFAGVMTILTSPISLVILAITALIAVIVAIIVYWDEISAALLAGWEWIKQKAEEIWNAMAEFFSTLWQGICNTITNVWNNIKDFFINIWNAISNKVTEIVINWINMQIAKFEFIKNTIIIILTSIKDFFVNIWNTIINTVITIIDNIKNTIQNVLNIINIIWSNVWNGLKNTVINIFNGIWNAIKNVINWILSGIEKMGNGVVNGINIVIRALNRLSFKMPDWLGGGQFGFNIQTLSTISLPRLAKGGIVDSPTLALIGEYSGAQSNPEIVTPQNIMAETFRNEMADIVASNESSSKPIRVQMYWGTKNVIDEIIDGINEKTRQTGKAQIKVAYDY